LEWTYFYGRGMSVRSSKRQPKYFSWSFRVWGRSGQVECFCWLPSSLARVLQSMIHSILDLCIASWTPPQGSLAVLQILKTGVWFTVWKKVSDLKPTVTQCRASSSRLFFSLLESKQIHHFFIFIFFNLHHFPLL
jgi:hypothetical protein